MKVCYVTMGFPLDVETFACTDVRMLRDAGVAVSVSTLLPAPRHAAEMLRDRGLSDLTIEYATFAAWWRGLSAALLNVSLSLSVARFVLRTTWRHPRFLLASFALLPRAFDIALQLERRPVDVVHLFWGHYPALVLYLLRRRQPSVVRSMFLGAYDLLYAYPPSREVACEADVLWTHARENVPVIAALGVAADRLAVVHRGVDLELFRPATKIPHRLVTACRLCREKHVDDVLHAFALVRRSHPDASLVVLGDGPERRHLEALAGALELGDAVRFLGHVPHHVVRDELATAECFVLMSREPTERLTNAIKEAMACECLVVVTDSPGIQELICDGVDGRVVPHAAIDRVAELVNDAFDNPLPSARLRRGAAQRIHEQFGAATAMAAYQRRWNELLGGPSSTGNARPSAAHLAWDSSSTDMV
jgi:glycosyltransferase involved in cell wall biosynthesis